MEISPIVLNGKLIRLEPLVEEHIEQLAEVGIDERIWGLMLYGQMQNQEDLGEWVRELLRRQSRGTDLPFTVFLQRNGKAVGCTRFMDIRPEHRSVEIGGTWYGVEYQGSGINIEAKYLLLQHAFETLGCVRVQLKTDTRNLRSQRAIERIGAVREGVLRDHLILPDGYIRSSVIYSILAAEWPEVKMNLERRLQTLEE